MAKIPGFLLKGLYVRGSLRNTEDGIEFQIKNEVQDGRMVGALPMKVDRKPVPIEDCSFIHGGEEVASADVSPENSVVMRKGEAVTVKVRGLKLRPGRHTIEVAAKAQGVGEIRFSIGDTVR
jgi:hydroxymethylglutaryl-CoA reductase (NADPH)